LNLKLLDDVKDALRTPKPEDLPRYQQMAEQLRPTYPVTPAQLAELANARAAALRDYLTRGAKLPASRLAVAPAPVAGSSDGQAVPLKLQLSAATATPAGSAGDPAGPSLPAR
jgi:septal ring-binding cell division protein DamX